MSPTKERSEKEEAAFQQLVARWKREGWPYQELLKDEKSARLLQDNGIFTCMKVYGHEWKWDEETKSLFLPVYDPSSPYKMKLVSWDTLKYQIKHVDACGWWVFDGAYYGIYGLTGVNGFPETEEENLHSWKWKSVPVAYQFPKEKASSYSFVDIVSCSWEHPGFQGFGFAGGPHGHASVEFCDGTNLYSVGQYPIPTRGGSALNYIFGTAQACYMAPDSYFTAQGEKTVHRYNIGEGEKGKANVQKLKKYIESIQAQTRESILHFESGKHDEAQQSMIFHNGMNNSCVNFALHIEEWIQQEFKGQVKLANLYDEQAVVIPNRKIHKKDEDTDYHHPFDTSVFAILKHYIVLVLVAILLNILYYVPFLSAKLGKGRGIALSASSTAQGQQTSSSSSTNKKFLPRKEQFSAQGALSLWYLFPVWPRVMKLRQTVTDKQIRTKSATYTCL